MKQILAVLLTFMSAASFGQTLTTKILGFTNSNATERARVDGAMKLIEEVVNTEDFRQSVLTMTYKKGKDIFPGFTQTTLSREQIMDSIYQGEENFTGGQPAQIDLFLDMYYEYDGAIAYTSPSDKYVHLNRYFHNSYTAVGVTGNLFHEWLHKIGHKHSYEWTSERPDSVPYKLGYLVGNMAAEIAAKGDVLRKEIFLKDFNSQFLNCSH